MARRRHKKRTHLGANNGPSMPAATDLASRQPKSMVIRVGAGHVGSSVSQLVKDVRKVMEPGTASRIKERRSNKLRDYTTMAGPLGVSHLLLFSKSSTGNTNLRVALVPHGPTLHFRVERYSLCKDVRKALKRPQGGSKEYLTAPLLVMNNASSPKNSNSRSPIPKHLEDLTTTVFQSLFPTISAHSTPLSSIRRVLLLNREFPKSQVPPGNVSDAAYMFSLRHYAIIVKPTGLSRGIRKIVTAKKLSKDRNKRQNLPNLGKLNDVADYLYNSSVEGNISGSESEIETEAEVEVLETYSQKVSNAKHSVTSQGDERNGVFKNSPRAQKVAVKLAELGPRMKLRMTKIEEGVCCGKVMWHEYINKSSEEMDEMEKVWQQRREEQEARRIAKKESHKRKENDGIHPAAERVVDGQGEDEDAGDRDWDS
ncbi:MAG: hypothetical protein Q9214_000360 [Letrouitia sp. 1 TL-2023]